MAKCSLVRTARVCRGGGPRSFCKQPAASRPGKGRDAGGICTVGLQTGCPRGGGHVLPLRFHWPAWQDGVQCRFSQPERLLPSRSRGDGEGVSRLSGSLSPSSTRHRLSLVARPPWPHLLQSPGGGLGLSLKGCPPLLERPSVWGAMPSSGASLQAPGRSLSTVLLLWGPWDSPRPQVTHGVHTPHTPHPLRPSC